MIPHSVSPQLHSRWPSWPTSLAWRGMTCCTKPRSANDNDHDCPTAPTMTMARRQRTPQLFPSLSVPPPTLLPDHGDHVTTTTATTRFQHSVQATGPTSILIHYLSHRLKITRTATTRSETTATNIVPGFRYVRDFRRCFHGSLE